MKNFRPATVGFLVLSAFLVLVETGHAAVFTVTNTNDSGPGSLRQAILDTNVNNQDDTINFDPTVFNVPRVIFLTTGELFISPDLGGGGPVRHLTINGAGADLLEINGSGHSRIFNIGSQAIVTIDKVKLSGGTGTSNGEVPNINGTGGALRIDVAVTVTLTNSIISGNRATHNSGLAGGIVNFGKLLIVNCAIVNNIATFSGGGISSFGDLSMYNSTLSYNTARQNAGIYFDGNLFHLVNSAVVLNNTTDANEAAAGIKLISNQFSDPFFHPRNSIMANNTNRGLPAQDVSGQTRSRGSNIFGTSLGIFFLETSPTDLLNVDAGIDFGLSTNGGVIPSHALRAGSPAIDSGDNCVLVTSAGGGCYNIAITHDHRGVPRPQDADLNGTATVDRGTFEALATEMAGVPGTPDLQAEDDSGASNTDNLTASPDVTFEVGGLMTGSTVELLRNGVVVASAVSTGASISLNDTLSAAGRYFYTARQTTSGSTSLQGAALLVVFDNVAPSGGLNQAAGQADPTRVQPMNFTLAFSEAIVGFEPSDVSFLESTAGTSSASVVVSGSSPSFSIAVSNITSDGRVVLSLAPGAVQDMAGNLSVFVSGNDNAVTLDTTGPTVTINQASTQTDPTRFTPINFTVAFSEPVTGFTNTDVSLAGSTANTGAASRIVSGPGPTYTLAISGVTANGATIVASIVALAAQDAAGNMSVASTSTDNSVTLDNTSPSVTINQSGSQPDPTNMLPVAYTVVFNEPVTGFDAADISLSSSTLNTAGASITVTGAGAMYTVSVGNIPVTTGGILRATVRTSAATDALGNPSLASSSTDNGVFLDTVAPSVSVNKALGQPEPTSNQPISFTAVFSEVVTGFQSTDVSLAGSTANVSAANVSITGTGNVYTISVSGVTSSGQVVVSIPAGSAQDGVGNQNSASTSTDNSVTLVVESGVFDFDGDGKSDIGIFRPSVAEWWINRSSNGSTLAVQFGSSTDRIVPADYTGDGKADVAVWRPASGEWLVLRSEDFSFYSAPFGADGDVPVPTDYDADGKADLAVFRSSSATWFIQRSTGGVGIHQFGANGDLPVAADYDGDGQADLAIFRPSNNQWWLNRSTAGILALEFGTSTDKLVQGDYTGDGKADVAFWRPATGDWFVLRSEDLSFYSAPFGSSTDIAAPGDYDGDGRYDFTVFRPTSATWFSQRTTAGTLIQQFGATDDRPIPNAFVP